MALLAVAMLAGALLGAGCAGKPQATATGYYTGPLRSKMKPGVYGNKEGKRVPAPA